jgi:predicted ATPase
MQFISSIKFINDVVFESKRPDHKNNFKLKKRTYTHINHHKSTYDDKGRRIPFKEKVTERTFVIFPKGFSMNFKPGINVIVGDNGCGKSSLLRKLFFPKFEKMWMFTDKTEEEYKKEHVQEYLKNKIRELTYVKTPELFVNGKEIHKNVFIDSIKKSKAILNPVDVLTMWDMDEFSNGENTLDFLRSMETIENALIMLDEPETSLSIKSQRKIAKLLKTLSDKNQVIVVTHAPVLMEVADEVYDFEKKEWCNTKEYIKELYK